jgi:hypothetical protein
MINPCTAKKAVCAILAAGMFSLFVVAGATAQESSGKEGDAIARIRDEGLNHSHIIETLSYLTDVIGPRLTGSPNLKRANEWTRDKLTDWGLTNAHLEAWGPFGRGWSLKRFSAQVVEPQTIPLIAYPNAWSPGFDKPIIANVVYFDVRTNADLEKYKGKLRGAIVLSGAVREVPERFEALAVRLAETNLLRLANAGESRAFAGRFNNPIASSNEPQGRGFVRRIGGAASAGEPGVTAGPARTNLNADARAAFRSRFGPQSRNLSFLAKEGVAAIVTPSSLGDGGTVFVAAATVPGSDAPGANPFTNTVRAWSTNVPAIPPQLTVAAEDYNRLVRMIQQGVQVKMALDLQVRFYDDDVMAYNTIAEIPGTDLKDELVMVGGHMDSWHAGTGATDNGAGVAAAMEAVRIIRALKLQPRRTIRIALWSGEEQGLYGSKAYVTKHFGAYTTNTPNQRNSGNLRTPKVESQDAKAAAKPSTNSVPARKLVREREYEKLSAYFNLDNGAGKIRGIYLQGNEAVRPLFRRWFEPFRDLGAETITLSNTGGTDHTSFDAIGLPGFQFIQDPLDYSSRTHHSNEDVMDRIQPDDLKQAAVILAAFVYNAAVAEDKLPRKAAD